MDLSWESKKITYILCGIFGLFLIVSLIIMFFQKVDADNLTFKGEKTLGHYEIVKKISQSPFIVDLLEVETNKTLKNVFISQECPDYENINIVKTHQLFRYTVMNVKTGVKTYEYSGLYEAVCTLVKKEIDEDSKTDRKTLEQK